MAKLVVSCDYGFEVVPMVARVEYLCIRLRGVSNLKHLEESDTKLPKESHISGITLILHVRRAPLKEMGRKGLERRGYHNGLSLI